MLTETTYYINRHLYNIFINFTLFFTQNLNKYKVGNTETLWYLQYELPLRHIGLKSLNFELKTILDVISVLHGIRFVVKLLLWSPKHQLIIKKFIQFPNNLSNITL